MPDSTPTRPQTFQEFWPHYVCQHRSTSCRALHYTGTGGGIALFVVGLLTGNILLILLAPAVGYGFAWFAHGCVENNLPATFGHAWWSFLADFRMLLLAVQGKMRREVDRVCNAADVAEDSAGSGG